MQMSTRDAVLVDNQRAQHVAANYTQAVNSELYARGLEFTTAIQKFMTFLKLEELPSFYENFINAAFLVLCVAQPELFLVKFLGEQEKSVKLALALSAEMGSKTARVLQATQRVHDVAGKAEKIYGKIEKAGKVNDAAEKYINAGSIKDLEKIDASQAVVKALIDSSRLASKIWSDAVEVLDREFACRLSDNKHSAKESLEQLAKRLLECPTPLTNEELDQIETAYLYEMIKAYAKTSVVVIRTGTSVRVGLWRTQPVMQETRFKNLNDNQQEAIIKYFFKAKRGRFFNYPPVGDIYTQMKMWGVRETAAVFPDPVW